jgi:hypothetical protein
MAEWKMKNEFKRNQYMNKSEGIVALVSFAALAFGLPFMLTYIWSRFQLRSRDIIKAYRKVIITICLILTVLGFPYALLIGQGPSIGDKLAFGFGIAILLFLVGLGHATGATTALKKLGKDQHNLR